jgi:nucleotide-binding universal stress UspA family protein
MYYKKVLVPLDGSDHAKIACSHAIALCKGTDSEIVLLYCFGEIPPAIGGDARNDLIAECERQGEGILAECMTACAEHGIKCTAIIRSGGPGRTIVLTSQAEHCDLIMMGSRGLSDFEGMVMGSVTHRVLRHSPIPILVVR